MVASFLEMDLYYVFKHLNLNTGVASFRGVLIRGILLDVLTVIDAGMCAGLERTLAQS